jgi:phage/plasmid-associated DNA primase
LSNPNTTNETYNRALSALKKVLLPDFWDIKGKEPRLVVEKKPIANYIRRRYNLISYCGRYWYYDRDLCHYTTNPNNEKLNEEINHILLAVGGGDWDYNNSNKTDTENILHLAGNQKTFTTMPFNQYPAHINCKNGILKLNYETHEVEFIGRDSRYMYSYRLGAEFKPEIQNDEIYKVLIQIFGEKGAWMIVQIIALSILSTDLELLPYKIILFMFGDTNTGKDTAIQIMRKLVGEENTSDTTLKALAENPFMKPSLEGKLLNFDSELPDFVPIQETSELKNIPGKKIHTLNPKNIRPYQSAITAILVCAGNQYPRFNASEDQNALWQRIEIIKTLGEQFKVDDKFLERLCTPENLSAFLNRVIEMMFFWHRLTNFMHNFEYHV